MTLPKLSLFPASHNDGLPMLSTLELASGGELEFVQRRGAEVGQGVTLQPRPEVLHRVAVRGIGWKERDVYCPVDGVQIFPNQSAAVGLQAIPDDQQLAPEMPAEGLEEFDYLRASNGAVVESKQAVHPGQSGDDRNVVPGEMKLNDRRLSFGCPSSYSRRSLAQSGLVYEDDDSSLAERFFLSLGNVFFFQSRTAWSSRSMARRSGFLLANPMPPSRRQTCTSPNSTPD